MRFSLLAVLSICLAGLALPAKSAEPKPERVWRGNGWGVYLYRDEDGIFDRCSTTIEYSSGRILTFSVGLDSHLIMRISHKTQPIGEPGQTVQTYIRIDGMQPRTAPAVIEQRSNGIKSAKTDFNDDYTIFGNLRRGYVLNLSGDLGQEQLSLNGSALALRKMSNCVPRPFAKEIRVRQLEGPIITAKLPVDTSIYGRDSNSLPVFNENMKRLHRELEGDDNSVETE